VTLKPLEEHSTPHGVESGIAVKKGVGIKKAPLDCRGLSYRSAELKFAITVLTTRTQAQASCIVLAPRSTTPSS
jgi:hypothetical protein